MADKRTIKRALLGLKILVSAGLLTWVLSRSDLAVLWEEMRTADPLLMFFAALTPFVGYGITSTRWRGLLRVAGVRVGAWALYRASLIAVFFNQFLPSTIGGDVARMYEAWKAGAPKPVAVSSLLVDRAIGTYALTLLASASLPFILREHELPPLLAVVVVALTLAVTGAMAMVFLPFPWVLGLFRAVYAKLPGPFASIAGKLDRAFEGYRGNIGAFVRALGWSLLLQLNVVLLHWLVAAAIGVDIGFSPFLFLVPVALIVMLIPVSINGIGIRESIFATLFLLYGVEKTQAVAIALLVFSVFLLHGVFGGIAFAIRGPRASGVGWEQDASDTPAAAAEPDAPVSVPSAHR
ncbi:MAG: lysylphosphatidylglycerol synthase transmembrane domain-containing protein [Planctomycetota bacterium]